MAFLASRSILAYKPMGLPWDWRASIFTKAIGLQPFKPGTCIMEVTLRVVSNLSFTAKFDVQKTPGFREKPGVFCILALSVAHVAAVRAGLLWYCGR